MRKAIIMGAAGRDFHNFNTVFRKNKDYKIIAFTATQIPGIDARKYPASLAGKRYPKGVPIVPEHKLESLIKKQGVQDVFFSYSDVSHEYVMHMASRVIAAGANFCLLGTNDTQIKSKKPVISVCAVRTGSGKSSCSQKIISMLHAAGKKVVVIRHPMPYGDLAKQTCQRFASYKDFEKHKCTIEEREEYEPYIEKGMVLYAGVDYEVILRKAEKEADVILWDGGNNDLPFYKPDVHIVIADPLRAGHEMKYHPGEANLRAADVIVINKIGTASKKQIALVKKHIKEANPKAKVIMAELKIIVDDPRIIGGKKVIVVEDGPTLTHGGMQFGAGILAAKQYGATPIDPRRYAVGSIKAVLKKYPDLHNLVPAMGYGKKQMKELQQTLNKAKCDAIIIGNPIDLAKLLKLNKPATRIRYVLKERGALTLKKVLKNFL